MSTFVLNITNLCNLRCLFCLDGDFKGRVLNVSSEVARERIREAACGGFQSVIFMGGETLVRRDFADLVRFTRSLGMEPLVATNGVRLADARYLKELVSCGLGGIEFSIHSHVGEIANRLSGSSKTARRQKAALANVAALAGDCTTGKSFKVIFNVVATSLNYGSLPGTTRFLADLFHLNPYVRVKFKAMRPQGRAHANPGLVPKLADVAPSLLESLAAAECLGLSCLVEMFPLCLVPGAEHLVMETRDLILSRGYGGWNPREGTHEGLGAKNNYTKATACGRCGLNSICAGLWTDYARLFGEDEVAPVPTDAAPIVQRILAERAWGWK